MTARLIGAHESMTAQVVARAGAGEQTVQENTPS